MHGSGREGTASAPARLENLALLSASASSSSASGRTISQPIQKDIGIYWSGHREGVSAAMGRLLHKFGVGKEGTTEKEWPPQPLSFITALHLPLPVGHRER